MAFTFTPEKPGLFVPFVFLFFLGQAQVTTDLNPGGLHHKLVLEYQQKIRDGSLLFTGTEYYYTDNKLTEHPFLKSDQPLKGSLDYFGVQYLDIPLQYDVLRDELILASNPALKIRLVREKITGFTLQDRNFLHLTNQNIQQGLLSEGFYEELLPGTTSLMARRKKKVKEILQADGITYQVQGADEFFLKKGAILTPIQNKRQLLKELGDYRKKIAGKLRKDKIKYRLNPEFYLIMAMRYYQQPNTL